VIVPSGVLSRFPFHLLVEPGGNPLAGPFLIQRHRVRYAPSFSVLHLNREWDRTRPRPSQPFWGVGDPIYQADDPRASVGPAPAESGRKPRAPDDTRDDPRSDSLSPERLPRLEWSGAEVRELARLVGAAPDWVLTGQGATEENVKEASRSGRLAKAGLLHFAVHGSLAPSRASQPCLVLSVFGRGDRSTEDGLLGLEEVTQLRLNADLVILSACETSLGTIYGGEGVLSLARAFLHAGSRGVLCSLWTVDDRSTSDLMIECYKGLKAGRTAADALRGAQLEMIARGAAPRVWAPFILIGE